MATVNDNGYSQTMDGNVRQNPFSRKNIWRSVYSVYSATQDHRLSLKIFQCNKGLDVYAVHMINWMFPQSIIDNYSINIA